MRLGRNALILGLLLAAFWAATLWRASVREAAAEADYPPQGQFVTVDGVKMHAVVAGQGRDLVLIHGASGSARDFTASFTARLTDRYRVIAVDRPGFGWSAPLPGVASIHDDARLVRGVAAALGADRPIVLGHSYGGAVALAWAEDAPNTMAALVLEAAPSHPWNTPLSTFYRLTSTPFLRRVVVPLVAAWLPESAIDAATAEVFAPNPVPEGYLAAFGAGMTLRRQTLYINAAERAGLLPQVSAMVATYPLLKMPIEAVHGDADTTVYLSIHSEPLAREAPTARLAVLPGIGHMPHHVVPEAVVAAIDRAAARAPE
ncbi:MAG TPA: alpha/beta hydrolase [Albidovulum sp.]|uniref:alpha/beta fold hydrolase n=1 Tax=Albidovulum sp. TaxID=1872424 RepID=UPI002C1ACBE0|nr:alpha/beta hydrolase [Albidovulum sp.]